MSWQEFPTEWTETPEITAYDEIPLIPETTNFWMLTESIAIHYSTVDQLWRFLLFTVGKNVRRSGETFQSLEEAKEYFEAGKLPTWIKRGTMF